MDHVLPTERPAPAPAPLRLDGVLAYWQGLRRGRLVPARTDLDPVALQPWLGTSGIVEVGPEGRLRLRLGGRGLSDLMGVEARGMPLRALFAVGARARLHELTAAVFDGPHLLTLTLVAPSSLPGARPVPVAMALMPLSDAKGAVTRALLCLSFEPRVKIEHPSRFHIRQAHLTPLATQPRLSGIRVQKGGAPDLRIIAGGRD